MSVHQQSHTRLPRRGRRTGLAFAILMCAGLSACTAVSSASPPAPSVEAVPLPSSGVLDAGTYVSTAFPVPFQITVPDGWEMKDGWLLIKGADDPAAVFLNFLRPTYVPTDACEWSGTLTDAGPSVQGFADALATQASTTTTPADEVTMGDYSGVEFDLAVESDIDITQCPASHICIHSESQGNCTRYYQSAGRSETYRVVDLLGDRAVITVGQDDGADADLVAEGRAIFDSLVFTAGE